MEQFNFRCLDSYLIGIVYASVVRFVVGFLCLGLLFLCVYSLDKLSFLWVFVFSKGASLFPSRLFFGFLWSYQFISIPMYLSVQGGNGVF